MNVERENPRGIYAADGTNFHDGLFAGHAGNLHSRQAHKNLN